MGKIRPICCLLLLFSCSFWPDTRLYAGASQLTLNNSGIISEYPGTVTTFKLYGGSLCQLVIQDRFITGTDTTKVYTGSYQYSKAAGILSFELTLDTVDGESASADRQYTLIGSSALDLDADTADLAGSLGGGNLPSTVQVNIMLELVRQ